MPELKGRQYREMNLTMAAPEATETETKAKRIDSENYVEGYAAKYEPYVLYEDNGEPINEAFERTAFDDCDMSDIILQYNHAGRVFARQSNGTLIVEPDDTGLFVAADLSKTELARQLYEDIKAGMITKMSWGFVPGEYHFEPATRTIIHTKVKKIYDVSVVSIPANENTEINARSAFEGVIEEAARRDAELEIKKARLRLKLKLEEVEN